MKPEFVFVACRYGSENLCKQEIAEQCTDLRFSFSQKGFLTFKADKSTANFQKINSLTFARLAGISLGSIDAEGPEFYNHLEEILSKSECLQKVKHLHVWDRNLGSGDEVLLEWLANGGSGSNHPIATDELSKFCSQKGWAINRHAKQDDHVIDLIRMDKNKFWFHDFQYSTGHAVKSCFVNRDPVPCLFRCRWKFECLAALGDPLEGWQRQKDIQRSCRRFGGISKVSMQKMPGSYSQKSLKILIPRGWL